jgi:hypothetical protein
MIDKALAIALAVAMLGCGALTLMLRSTQAEKDAALADKARLSVVVDEQRAVIDAMQADARIRDRALADRDKTISTLNAAAFSAVEAIGTAINDQTQCISLDDPLPASLSGPLLLLHSQAGDSDRAAGDTGHSAASAVSGPANARAAVSLDTPPSRTVDGAATGVGR